MMMRHDHQTVQERDMSELSQTPNNPENSAHWDHIGTRAKEIFNVRTEIGKQRTRMPARIDRLGNSLAQPAFFLSLLASHLFWIVLNLPLYPWWKPWDPYPFIFIVRRPLPMTPDV
jgi:uncharacterized membrane protein